MQFDNKCNETFLCYENHMYLKERRSQLKSDINILKNTVFYGI